MEELLVGRRFRTRNVHVQDAVRRHDERVRNARRNRDLRARTQVGPHTPHLGVDVLKHQPVDAASLEDKPLHAVVPVVAHGDLALGDELTVPQRNRRIEEQIRDRTARIVVPL